MKLQMLILINLSNLDCETMEGIINMELFLLNKHFLIHF